MASNDSTDKSQEQQQGTTQTSEYPSQDWRSQSQFDQAFSQQIGTQRSGSVDWAAAYFEACEQQLRTARRIVEQQTLHLMRQEIVQDVTQAVLSQLRQQGVSSSSS